MSESKFDLNNYPNLIAVPYKKTLDEKDSQRKDHQRICLEMILAYNASVCLANYYYYKTVEAGEDNKSKKDEKIGQDLPDLPSHEKIKFDLGVFIITQARYRVPKLLILAKSPLWAVLEPFSHVLEPRMNSDEHLHPQPRVKNMRRYDNFDEETGRSP